MTAKEKAEELVNKMAIKFHDGTSRADLKPNFKIAENKYFRECALIAVDEIIEELYGMGNANRFNYWKEVKQEIEKL